jgi:hypothetical protein
MSVDKGRARTAAPRFSGAWDRPEAGDSGRTERDDAARAMKLARLAMTWHGTPAFTIDRSTAAGELRSADGNTSRNPRALHPDT